jgi:hypothetical protein
MGGTCSTYGGLKNTYKIFVGKPERRSLGRTRRRWESNIQMDHKEIGGRVYTGAIWLGIGTVGGALVDTVMNLLIPLKAGLFKTPLCGVIVLHPAPPPPPYHRASWLKR